MTTLAATFSTTTQPTYDGDWLRDPARSDWFWARVLVSSVDPDACWPWAGDEGTYLPSGHVRLWLPGGSRWLAHRAAFVLSGGELLEGEMIRHRCPGDANPSCVNPRHLSAGSALDNARDRDAGGRRTPFLPKGEKHWSARLSQEDADRLREARRLGVRADDAARIWHVSRATIYAVWSNRRYPPSAAEPASQQEEADVA